MSSFSPYPQRYLSLGYDGSGPCKCTSSTLAGAIKALRQQNGIAATAEPEEARLLLREWVLHAGGAFGLWGLLPDGYWLSLDPEEAQDALRSEAQLAAYEAALTAPSGEVGSPVYQVRTSGSDQAGGLTDYSSVRAALTAFAEAVGFPFLLGPDFTWALLRADLDHKDIALCARIPDSVAAVPIPLKRAEEALTSNHAELKLAAELRSEFLQKPDWAFPD